MDVYGPFFRSALSRLDPELTHLGALGALQVGSTVPWLAAGVAGFPRSERLAVDCFGLPFENPLGVAAGFDKDAVAVPALRALGFGHVEIGTVTPRPQSGNVRPRLFRLSEDRALINRLGFPSRGVEQVTRRLVRLARHRGVIGVNLGKNRETPLERAVEDYLAGLVRLGPLADYVAINVSSPNTPGLRSLQRRAALGELCAALVGARPRGRHARPLPMLLKLSPDLNPQELDDALDVALSSRLDGLVIANTTIARDGLRSPQAFEQGGLSGEPLRRRVDNLISTCAERTHGRLPIVAVGGVFTAEHAWDKLRRGAALVQLYTGLVYAGPGLARSILDGLRRELDRAGFQTLEQAFAAWGRGQGPGAILLDSPAARTR